MGQPVGEDITSLETGGLLIMRMDLIEEEALEIADELPGVFTNRTQEAIDKAAFTKELADLLYVTYGMAVTFGLPLDEVFERVHRSNMSKLDDNGKPIYREDGKVLKGPNYEKPNLDDLF